MSKAVRDYMQKHPEKFESFHTESNDRACDYWVYCREPWFNPHLDTQTIHEDTVRETLATMRKVVEGFDNGYCWEALQPTAS